MSAPDRDPDGAVDRRPGQRAGLSRTAVLDAARGLLSAEGPQGLTMRALARRLGVAPNALYSHVPGKTALVDELLDDVLAGAQVPDPDATARGDVPADPLAALRCLLESTYDLLLGRPELAPLYVARQGSRGPNAQHLGEVTMSLLAQAGVTGPAADEARRVLVVYTMGFAALASGPPAGTTEPGPLDRARARTSYVTGLEWLLDGIRGAGQARAGADGGTDVTTRRRPASRT